MKSILFLFISCSLAFAAKDEISDDLFSTLSQADQLQPGAPKGWSITAKGPEHCRVFHGTNFYPNLVLSPGTEITTTIKFSEMMDKRRKLKEPARLDPQLFYGLLAFDVLGTLEETSVGAYQISLQADGEAPLIRQQAQVTHHAHRTFGWPYQILPESTAAAPKYSYHHLSDLKRATLWKAPKNSHQAELILDLGKSRTIAGLTMMDHKKCAYRQFEVFTSQTTDFGAAVLRAMGPGSKGEAPAFYHFTKPVQARYLKIRFLNKYRWADLGLAELAIFPPQPQHFYGTSHRHFIKIAADKMAKYNGKEAQLRIKSLHGSPVILGNFEFFRLHEKYTAKMTGSSNKENGPDEIDLGALGCEGIGFHDYSVLPIIKVVDDSPAAKAGLQSQDLLVGVNGQPLLKNSCKPGGHWLAAGFEPEIGRRVQQSMGRATVLNQQRKEPLAPRLQLEVLRDGTLIKLPVELRSAGLFSPTFPYNDPFAAHIFKDLCDYLVTQQHESGAWHHGIKEINTAMAGLALLSANQPDYLPAIRKAVQWVIDSAPDGIEQNFWKLAYQGIFLSEYFWATGDEQVLPWIRTTLKWLPAASHKSKWDLMAFGHSHKGLPYGQKGLVAPGLHCLVFDSLARRACRLDSKVWPTVIDYMIHAWSDPAKGGHGAVGYNASLKDTGQAWSRSGNFLLAINIRGEETHMAEPLTNYLHEYHANMFNSHAYGMPGAAWGLVALANADRQAFHEMMQAYSWWFVNAWNPGHGMHYSEAHMGAPYMGRDLMATAALAMVLGSAKHNLLLSGGRVPGLLKGR